MDFNKTIGARLKIARKSAGFKSAKTFAAAILTPLTTYAQHESGKRAISIEKLLYYADVLKADPNWLIFGETNQALHSTQATSTAHTELMDMQLYNQIVACLLNASKRLSLNSDELIEFCMDVYRTINMTSASDSDRKKMIELSVSSLVKGYQNQNKKHLLEKVGGEGE